MSSIKARKGKKGTTHTVRVRVKGCQPKVKTFDRITDAKDWAIKTEAKMKSHRDFPERKAGKRTVKDANKKYIKEGFANKKGSKKKQTAQLNWWEKAIGHVQLSYLTPEIICEARSKLFERVSNRGTPIKNATVNRYMSALSAVLTATVSTWFWLSSNPALQIPQLPEDPGRTRFLSKDELLRLTKACQESRNKRLLALFLLAVATGLRKSEALRLKWTDIDWERETAYIRESKNGEPRTLPLEGPVRVELEECYNNRRNDSELIFHGKDPKKPMNFSGAWKYALKRAKIFNFVYHDTRHTTGSYLAMSGATIAEIADILGQKTIAVAKRYAHHTVEHKRRKLIEMNQAHIPTDLVNAAMQHSEQAKADEI